MEAAVSRPRHLILAVATNTRGTLSITYLWSYFSDSSWLTTTYTCIITFHSQLASRSHIGFDLRYINTSTCLLANDILVIRTSRNWKSPVVVRFMSIVMAILGRT